ncbi:hypothetical protein E1B28_001071 [Marasmius oreades]|uniref:Uncharacterized protein n=1 Tax=Marasmius oreades TaxID=181124 RepID=A0A9P7V2N2_9AGAR|nr:uncharacterized protein E1B28_001071 [Marasmius oreades]KAG7099204.1 hypothetical protein E1B28_001071 [Marasmius oreades]
MGTLIDIHSTVPSENWDEDFEFHASPNNHKCVSLPSHPTRASTTSTAFTEDWDKDADVSPLYDSRPFEMTSTQTPQENPDFHLTSWAEPGPSTPTKRPFSSSTENWDDDFEDKTNSPAIRISPRNRQGDTISPSRPQFEPESWDDEFDLASPATLPKSRASVNDRVHSGYDDEEDDDMDFNLHDKDEDRTVTARSRRNALPRLSTSDAAATFNATPPPPVPPIPMSLLNANNSTALHFPRSPTTSVFSAPSVNSGRNSVAYSYYHNSSTTHLRPTVSRQSTTGFANLPPSPPIHKERERRRLRKKSRPDPASLELNFREPLPIRSVNTSVESVGLREDRNGRPITPQTAPHSSSSSLPPAAEPSTSPPITTDNRNSIWQNSGPSSPPTKMPLLSRIGSVKKWGVRKKRASSTPSELMVQEGDIHADISMTGSSPSYSRSPSKSSNWFSRVTSGGGPVFEIGRKTSVTLLADRAEEESVINKLALTPKARKITPPGASNSEDTSAKLVKRKSSGFVPLRRDKGLVNDNSAMHEAGELPLDLEQELGLESDTALGRSPSKRKKEVVTHHIHQGGGHNPSYGGLGLGRARKPHESSSEDLTEKEAMRSRVRSFTRFKGKARELPEDKEGHRNFMGNVQRISLVGRHKRTKSGVSLVSVEEIGKDPPPLHRNYSEGDEPMNTDSEAHPALRTPSRSSGLLPPIELQPPSPPRVASDETIGKTAQASSPANIETLLLPRTPPSTSPPSLVLALKKPPTSPQAASLGRSTVAPAIAGSSAVRDYNVPRRNSLGDLKIPARISQAQVGLRRDLGMVREFAANVEQLKELQVSYITLVSEVQGVLDTYAQQASSRATSPNFFGRSPSRSRNRSNSASAQGTGQPPPQQAYKQFVAAFYTINSKYKIAWECAELLIELGTGSAGASPPSTSVSVPTMSTTIINEAIKSRERAITLSGEESKPPTPVPGQMSSSQSAGPPIASPPNLAWRASTGRHDLSHRQLLLLREMLNNPDTSQVIDPQHLPSTEEFSPVNRDWRWGEAMNSTVTLPSEESSAQGGSNNGDVSTKKRRSSKLVGMSGLRDMLRSLKRSQVEHPPVPASSTSLSTESSVDSTGSHRYPHGKITTYGRRRAKTSSGPELVRTGSPYNVSSSLSAKQSPRRPSLASIFRIGQKSKQTIPSTTQNTSTVDLSVEDLHHRTRETSSSTGEGDDDWDHVSELDHNGARAREVPTIRGRSPYLQDVQLPGGPPSRPQTPRTQRSSSASHSQTSLQREGLPPASVGVPTRTNRLSNVEEIVEYNKTPRVKNAAGKASSNSSRPPSRSKNGSKTGSVRSMPQPLGGLPDAKLAMTPENIRPLLENSKEVHARLTECIAEIRQLLAVD